ncbi:esterase family protein [Nonomuraea sp. NN258]|uniref:alpha/beta hydrolase n=1 Tax=Nonomuraea antri TaxID=2730852 RepID=UPI001569D18D|nr:alpha/beta hydrolase family protein [Nonomuraea antri]NRQ32200.1 esterase family protein [Nonomuraea antri]
MTPSRAPAEIEADAAAAVARLRGQPGVLDAHSPAGRLVELTVDSRALGGEGRARVLVPPGYAAAPARRRPVLYLLHGLAEPDWLTGTAVDRDTAGYPALVVMPDGGAYGFYSDWLDGPAWARFHLTELSGLVERGLGGGPRQAVAGFSMGGFGALSYAARHPGRFAAVASYSGLTDSLAGAANVMAAVEAFGGDPAALWGDPVADAAVWHRHNPYDLVHRLRATPVWLASGDGRPGPFDPPGAPPDWMESWVGPMNARFAAHARAHGVRPITRLYGPGGHSWPYWDRELRLSLPFLMAALGAHGRPDAARPQRRSR